MSNGVERRSADDERKAKLDALERAECAEARAEKAETEVARLRAFLLGLAVERNCHVCGAKIDRYEDPARPGELLPYWETHDSTCELRLLAGQRTERA